MSSSLFSSSSSKPGLDPRISMAKQMYKTLQGSSNPSQMIQQMAMSNPQIQAAYQTILAAKDPQTAFVQAAKAKGLTDEQIQNGIKNLQMQFTS